MNSKLSCPMRNNTNSTVLETVTSTKVLLLCPSSCPLLYLHHIPHFTDIKALTSIWQIVPDWLCTGFAAFGFLSFSYKASMDARHECWSFWQVLTAWPFWLLWSLTCRRKKRFLQHSWWQKKVRIQLLFASVWHSIINRIKPLTTSSSIKCNMLAVTYSQFWFRITGKRVNWRKEFSFA